MQFFHTVSKAIFIGASVLALSACSVSETKHDEVKNAKLVDIGPLGVPSGNYTMDKTHGYVTFSYLHKGLSNPQLRFNDVDASLVLDGEHPENSQVNVTIKAANIDSGVAKFDTHLNSSDFFNSAKNPTISFNSTSFIRASATTGTMNGDLTMMGVTKAVKFDVNLVGTAEGDNPAIGVEGRGSLLRSEFGLGKYVPYVGDKVSIVISAEFLKDK